MGDLYILDFSDRITYVSDQSICTRVTAPDLAEIANFKVHDAVEGKFTIVFSHNLMGIFIPKSCRMHCAA